MLEEIGSHVGIGDSLLCPTDERAQLILRDPASLADFRSFGAARSHESNRESGHRKEEMQDLTQCALRNR